MAAIVGNSYGYTGSIDTVEFAQYQAVFGNEYFVASQDAAKVSVVGASARTVRVAAGVIGGFGVVDDLSGTVDLQLPDPASGTVYYTIVVRRTWQASDVTTIEYVTGTTTKAIAAGRNTSPGIIDDQPLALVAVTSGNPTPSVVADLRAVGYGRGYYHAYDTLTLSYMDKPGYIVRIDGTEWLRLADNTWIKKSPAVEIITSGVYSSESPFNGVNLQTYLVRDGRHRHLFIEQSAFNSAQYGATSGSNDIADVQTLTLANSRDFPAHTTDVMVKYNYSESGAWAIGAGVLYPGGGFHLTNLTPGLPFRGRGIGGPGWDLRFTVTYWSATP